MFAQPFPSFMARRKEGSESAAPIPVPRAEGLKVLPMSPNIRYPSSRSVHRLHGEGLFAQPFPSFMARRNGGADPQPPIPLP
jgi:hypothetical protein